MYTHTTQPTFYFPYSYPSPRRGQDDPEDLVHVLTTGRRSHKLSASTRTVVWPVKLEAALIKALKVYAAGGHCTKPARRHPKRNRFISDYIKNETGHIRTPKQIGSRIQQLKETCPDPTIQALINQLAPEDPWVIPPSPPRTKHSYASVPKDITSSPVQLPQLVSLPTFQTEKLSSPVSYPCQSASTHSTSNWWTGYPPAPGPYIPPAPFESFSCHAPMYSMGNDNELIYAL
ncbi:hypothetical protein DL96DRAFT_1705861 [Flagelloscypha sp. PMI_526]|nr:hypothetical protein DL96DRAFT_1705861 [Flagelloscypha sp. PMI_526]